MIIGKPSRQVLRRAAIRARRMQRSLLRKSHGIALSRLAIVAGVLLTGPLAYANPTGGEVAAGSATIGHGAPGTLNIFQQSNRAIINWQGFSIAAGETVNFLQPSSGSVTLNRVLGNDPSAIFGRLNANGTVMLVNPNGIVFGPTSRVDVGGLIASTANIRNSDFMAGLYEFTQASPVTHAAIENHGLISIKDSGLAALVAPRVRNSGVIEARLGRVVLGAANTFTLDFHGDGLLSFGAGAAIGQAPGDGALVVNSGEIRADGGSVLLTARAVKGVVDQVINTDGLISATTVSGANGRIVLSGGDTGTVAIAGRIDASAAAGGQGGTVVATGEHVAVASGTHIDASGRHGGGEIALGSSGLTDAANPFANKSRSVSVAAGAVLNADATGQGHGGVVTMWSKEQTVFAGSLSARGGAQGGDGGFAEVSSEKNIGLTGSVDLRAPQGRTGTLLIDPTDLRITDTASGGSQDGNAGDGTVAAGDANQGSGSTLNTVSRGLLEGMAGTANIVLQATGQITVDAMAGGRIDLATTAGHGFTLQSTQTGGIRFVDADTEVRTQGGDITLEALGIGSSLSNIGRLTTNGGAVTLRATGDVQLGGAVNAGAGAVQVQSTVGSISNASATAPLVTGSSVALTAGGGSIGASGSAISTHTTQLNLEAGGSIYAASDMALAGLSVTALHVAPGTHTYNVSGTGLTFQLTDGSTVSATQIAQAGLNLTLASDRNLELGTIHVGAGTVSARSTGGNLSGAAGNAVTASSTTLAASGSTGSNGAIGTSGQAINTTTSTLHATSGSGGAYVANTGALALDTLDTSGASNISSTGTLTAGDVNAGSATLALGSSGGSVLDDGDSATRITAGTLNLTAGGAIGSGATRVSTSASTLTANAAVGGIYASTSATSSVLSSITSGNGAIDITTGGSTTLTSLVSSTSSAANDITVAATGTGAFSVGTVNAGTLGDVTLTTSSGSISGNSGLITGDTVTLNAVNSGSVSVRTAASHLDVQAGSSSISITQTGAVTLDRISTPSTLVSVTSTGGDITVGTVSTSTSGQVTLNASEGAIFDDGNSATRITTGTASLSAASSIGDSSHAVQTQATGLTVNNTGNLFVTNSDATLTSLSITNRHSAPGNAAILDVISPYLTFLVNDTGTDYELHRLVSVPLNSLSFNGDGGLVAGRVQAGGSVTLTSTQGSITDDGNLQSRITAGSTLTLSAAQGSVGSVANPMGVNASSLALTTRGDLYVTNLTDLSTLTLTSTHADSITSHGMAITAPSLKFSVTDSAAGHAVNTLTDNSSLSLTFTSDRDITLGHVDVTHTGTARFTSTGGAIKDDGDKDTRLLANSTTLSGQAVGAAGAAHMDVVTGTLAATASAGGVYVQVPMPTGSTNTTSTVTLGTITATGPVAITAVEGDLSLGGFMTATNQAVTLTAMEGSIFSPSGYSIAIGTGSLTLDAAHAIGTSSRAIPVTSSAGATLTAQAGTSMFVSGSGPMILSGLDAGTSISYTQSSGAITVGHVDATAGGTVAITATTGAIVDDGNGATGVTANQVSLSAAQSSVGSSGAAIAVAAPKLLVTANGTVEVTDSATLDTLSITRSSGSSGAIAISGGAGQTFTLSEDGTEHYLQQIDSATPLAFSFSGQRNVKIGRIDVGTTGSASVSSTASLVNDGDSGSGIAAGTVSLTAGTAGSIGATGSGNAIALEGTTALTLSAGRNFFATSDVALTDLGLTSTNTTTAGGTASVFGIGGLGQTFGITDSGTTQSLNFSGTALTNASFTTRKNIEVGAITATGDVTLSTSGGGANSNISSDSGSGTIAGNRVLLTATSSTAGGGSIGSSGTALRVDTPTVILNGSANVYVSDAQNLTRLDMTLTHGTNTTFGYGVTAGNLNSFSITDGSTQSLGMAVSGAMDFSYSVDRALSLATIDAGTSTTGSISLTSRSAPTGTNAQINRSSGSLTGGTITLSAMGTNGGVGAGATLSTNTKNLNIASGGNVSVSNSTTLTSLNLDARHNTSGSSTHSYSISSTGLTFSISDTLGNNAFQLSNISQSGLDLTVKADRVITASSVNTGAGGKVTLHSNSYVQGGSGANAGSPSITTGNLTLNGGSAFGYQGSTPLYTAAGTLSSSLTNTLYLSNAGALTLKTNTVGSSADVASSNNSLLQDSGGLFTTPTLKLSANQSLGSNATLLTDARRLTLVARNNIDVSNASDLYALTMTSTHATAGVQNTISVAAPRLALALTDSVGGDEYHLSNLVDSTGLDFTLSTDVALSLGTVNAQAGRSLALYSTGSTTSITNDGASLLTAGSITLSAGGSVGAAGGSGTRMQTDALGVSVSTGANAYLDNAQDLSSLSLTSSQTTGGVAPVYQFTAPALTFDVTDDGTTHINHVADSTGLNFVLNTQRSQAVDTIDVGRSGTVSLTSTGDILGDADSSNRISAASVTLYASNGGAIGSVGNPIRVSAPLLSLSPTGALNVESDTHIDRLSISTTHPTVTYGGTYSIVSVPITGGGAYALFTATDSVTGTALTSLDDTEGLAFSFTSDGAMQVGTLNLGTTGTVALTGTGSGGILGDGNPNTLVQAASLSMVSYGGAVGASGSGNGIDATVNSISATAQGGGVYLALHGRTNLGSISATGGIDLANDEGDIALGSIDAGGNAVSINNQGGSILSGSIFNTTTVALTASGSIGNTSAIGTSANGGGTTTLTASASAAHGASGSIAISESYNLAATSVVAPAAITLSSGYTLSAGTITSGGAVSLSSSQGSITGIDGSNAITGTSVDLSARYGTGNGIGSSGTRLNLNTPHLTVNTPGSVYITDSADLTDLTIDRTNYASTDSSGTLSLIGSNLTFSATDTSNTTTLTNVVDSTGLNFTYYGIGSVAVGTVDLGSGSALLQAYLSSGDGNITAVNGSSRLTAGSATLQAYGSGSTIGTSGTAFGTAVESLTASSGTGGMHINQAGSLTLSNLSTTGDIAVTATAGDLTLGTLSAGSGGTLSLTASAGSILAGTGTLTGSSSTSAITLSAANGIGTAAAPVLVNASANHTVSASVTGNGSLYLSSTGTLNGGLTTSVHNGATTVTAAGSIRLASMTTGTDAAGNDIHVTASAGDITVVNVSGGSDARHTGVNLTASAGSILGASGATLEAYEVTLFGANGVGNSTDRIGANGQRVQVASDGGAIYLNATAPSVLSNVDSNGGRIDIVNTAHLYLANASSGGGDIVVNALAGNVNLTAGNIDAGAGAVSLGSTGTGGTIQDDGNASTRITGASVALNGAAGVGSALNAVQTSADSLTVVNDAGGAGLYVDDANTNGVTLSTVVANGGDVVITGSGDLTLASVTATTGNVNLSAAGSILASGSGTHITTNGVQLTAGADIGVVTDLTTGAGTPIRIDATSLDGLTTTGSNAVVSIDNLSTSAWTLGSGGLSMGSGGSAYLRAAGDLNVSAGLAVDGNLLLSSAGVLTLPTAGISTTGALSLTGTTDVVTAASGAAARELQLAGDSIHLRSGAAGGDTTLTTTTNALDAALTGAGALTVNNTGTLASTLLATSEGDITATSSTGMTAGSVIAGGTGRAINLSTTSGNLTVGTLNAGSGGALVLSAANGSLLTSSALLTGSTLDLTAGNGIGSSGTAFDATGMIVSAQVTGTGGIYLASTAGLTTGALTTADGDIAVTAAGDLDANGALSAGQSGNVSLTSTGGNVTLAQAFVNNGLDTSRSGLSVQGQQISVGTVTTTGAQTYTGALTLGADTALSGAGVAFVGTVDGAHALTVNAGSGGATFGGAVGGTTRLGALTVNSSGATTFDSTVRAASVSTDAAGSLALNGGSVDTTGSQTYGERAVLGTDTTLTGSTVTLSAGADGATAGQDLAIAGNFVNSGALGANQSLGSLSVSGTSGLNAHITTAGAQTYTGAVTLGADTTLSGVGVEFTGTVDGAHALTVNAGSGAATFNGAVGGITRLGALTVNSSGATTFGSTVRAASLTTDAAGTLALNGGSVDTTGSQTYGEHAVLGTDTTLTATTVTLSAGADGVIAGQDLTIAGSLVSGGALGGTLAFGNVNVSGTSTLGGNVTADAQTYAGAVTLAADAVLTGAGVSFDSTLDGAHALTVNAGSGAVTFGGAIGGATRLGALQIDSSGATTFDGAVRAASVTTDAAGTLALNGGSVNTTGTQTYGERAVLGANTTLTGTTVSLAQGADAASAGAHSLSIAGDAVLGNVGANQALAALSVSGTTTLGGASVTTTGGQTYTGAFATTGDATLSSSGGALVFGSTVDGPLGNTLTLQADAGDIDVTGALTVGHLVQTAGGTSRFRNTLTAAGDVQLTAHSFTFDNAVTATNGAIALTNNADAGTVTFAAGATVQAATGFLQTGGSMVYLPAEVRVTQGPISLEAPARLPAGLATIETHGDITMAGLVGSGTALTLNAGPTGILTVGLNDASADHKLNVASLSVQTAASATMYGAIGGQGGALAASRVDSPLVNAPYFLNGTPWGPVGMIATVTAVTAPQSVVPSTLGMTSLFSGNVIAASVAPNALSVFADPQVLSVQADPSQNGGTLEQSGDDDKRKKQRR